MTAGAMRPGSLSAPHGARSFSENIYGQQQNGPAENRDRDKKVAQQMSDETAKKTMLGLRTIATSLR